MRVARGVLGAPRGTSVIPRRPDRHAVHLSLPLPERHGGVTPGRESRSLGGPTIRWPDRSRRCPAAADPLESTPAERTGHDRVAPEPVDRTPVVIAHPRGCPAVDGDVGTGQRALPRTAAPPALGGRRDPRGRRGLPLRPRGGRPGSGQGSTGRRSSSTCRCAPCRVHVLLARAGPDRLRPLARLHARLRVLGREGPPRRDAPRPAARHSAEHSGAGLHAGPGARAGRRFSAQTTSAWSWPRS